MLLISMKLCKNVKFATCKIRCYCEKLSAMSDLNRILESAVVNKGHVAGQRERLIMLKAAASSSGCNMMTKKQLTGISLVLTLCGLYKT
jgi:hypothetical protein